MSCLYMDTHTNSGKQSSILFEQNSQLISAFFISTAQSYQEVNPAKKDPVSVSMIIKRRTFLKGIVATKAIV